MNLKKIILYIALGFCLGGMYVSAINELATRTGNWGGEVLFLPCAVLLIWFGYTMHSELSKLKSITSNGANKK